VQQHSGETTFFCRTWNEFKVGFGDVVGNYWIGNDRLHQLTTYGKYKLRVDVQLASNQQWYWAEYSEFIVDDESSNYMLHVGRHSGTAGDSLYYIDGAMFSTRDRNDRNSCVNNFHAGNGAGFWYMNCGIAEVNSPITGYWGFVWSNLPTSTGATNKLSYSRMRLFPIC